MRNPGMPALVHCFKFICINLYATVFTIKRLSNSRNPAMATRNSHNFLYFCFVLIAGVIGPLWAHPSFAANCQVVEKARLHLSYTNTLPVVAAKINGKDTALGFDMGAQTFITPEAVSHHHLPRDEFRRTRSVGTTAIITARNVLIRDFQFAGTSHRMKSVAAIALVSKITSGESSLIGAPLEGILGADILADYDLDLDFINNTLTLYKVSGCASVQPRWTGTFEALPVKVTGQRRISVPVILDGHKLRAIFDTGANQSAVSRAAASRIGIAEAVLKADNLQSFIGAGNIAAKLRSHRFQALAVGEETMRDVRLGILKIPLLEADMLLGHDYMRSKRFWISYATKTVFVQAGAAPVFAQPQPQFSAYERFRLNGPQIPNALPPLALPRTARPLTRSAFFPATLRDLSAGAVSALHLDQEHALLVAVTRTGASGNDAGLAPGDVILALDGEPVTGVLLFLDALGPKSLSDPINLTLWRDGRPSPVTVRLIASDGMERLYNFSGLRKLHLEEILQSESLIAQKFSRELYPEEWLRVKLSLASAYFDREQGNRAENVEQSIQAYEAALTVLTPSSKPKEWAAAKEHLAGAYLARVGSERSNGVEHALQCYREALAMRTAPGDRFIWARISAGIGHAYMNRLAGVRAENIDEAIKAYEAALNVLTAIASPKEWAAIEDALGTAYRLRTSGDMADNAGRAIKAYEAALTVRTSEAAPFDWASTEKNLGLAHMAASPGAAMQAYEKALTVFTGEAFPEEHAEIVRLLKKAQIEKGALAQPDVSSPAQASQKDLYSLPKAGDRQQTP
jgi:tetratricopeptide (TPR) repeat protein